jgi:hypothetical protein
MSIIRDGGRVAVMNEAQNGNLGFGDRHLPRVIRRRAPGVEVLFSARNVIERLCRVEKIKCPAAVLYDLDRSFSVDASGFPTDRMHKELDGESIRMEIVGITDSTRGPRNVIDGNAERQ